MTEEMRMREIAKSFRVMGTCEVSIRSDMREMKEVLERIANEAENLKDAADHLRSLLP